MSTTPTRLLAIAALLSVALSTGCQSAAILIHGERRELRPQIASRLPKIEQRPKLLIIGIDGCDRSLLYDMLRKGEMPDLARMLGGRDHGKFPHAYFDDTVLSVMPSATLAAWASVFTGRTPAEHGVTGNEFFIRESLTFAAPSPVTFDDSVPAIKMYTEDYANRLLAVPTIYERMREKERDITIWVSMSQYYTGADTLLMPLKSVIGAAFAAFLANNLQAEGQRGLYEKVDQSAEVAIEEELEEHAAPDVLTLYLPGTDNYAHVSTDSPTPARREYLHEVVDPLLGKLYNKLSEKRSMDNRYVILVSDHGHTEVEYDWDHALFAGPPAVLRGAGFRVRPFALETGVDDFNAVLAYGGACAYVYVADRSASGAPNWNRPPRFKEDVLEAADAFYRANETGEKAPSMKGTLDLILTRAPKAFSEVDEPFQVYIGNGKMQPISAYLKEHPHPTYVDTEDRLTELAAGRFGERAGDVMLIAHNGDRDLPSKRYYFAERYRSWHGSPSRQDSEVPFIVAHPNRTADDIGRTVKPILGVHPRLPKVADVILKLRADQ